MMSKVTTFYSYKGGSGRSMTMANVAWALATNGEKVLAIDWDLEAPGLHRYFHPFLADPEQSATEGLIDRIWAYIDGLGADVADLNGEQRFAATNCDEFVQELELPVRTKGCLHLLGAGRQDDAYSSKVGGLDWGAFYDRFDGEGFVERLMAWARGRYSHILIDSRTGVADTAGICTSQVPDEVVLCLVYNRQSIEGTAAIARSIVVGRRERKQPRLKMRPIPCRVEERGVVDSARRYAADRLSQAISSPRSAMHRLLKRDEIRHFPWCAFEEKLAVFEDEPDERGSLLDAMHDLAHRIAERPLKIMSVNSELLATFWRRAAFDDPRLAELETLDEATFETAHQRLFRWIDEALATREERADWLIALAEAAVAFAGRTDDRLPPSAGEYLGQQGLRIAHRAADSDPQRYRMRFALLLQQRAAQLVKAGDFAKAIDFAEQGAHLLEQDRSPVGRWRRARLFERIAEIFEAMGDRKQSLQASAKTADLYRAIDRRGLPLGAEIDAARALRILAEKLLAQGDAAGATAAIDAAIAHLSTAGKRTRERDSVEIANILALSAQIAVEGRMDHAERTILIARMRGQEFLDSETASRMLDQRLRLVEANRMADRGELDDAIAILERLASEPALLVGPDVLITRRAQFLLAAGRGNEAADLLISATADRQIPFSAALSALLVQVLQETHRQEEFLPILLERVRSGDARETRLLADLLKQVMDPVGPAVTTSGWGRSLSWPASSGGSSRDRSE